MSETSLTKLMGEDIIHAKDEKVVIETLIEFKDVKAYVREDTSDSFVVKEVHSGEYRKLNINESDVVIDFGLNIGMFTTFACKRGAKKVYSFEPEHDNFILATRNIELNGFTDKCELINAAVVGNDDKTRDFSINVKRNKGAHSLVKKRGRDTVRVNCVNINKILERVHPTIVKMDIEGGEYECLKSVKSFTGIREFIMEFHHAHLHDVKTHKKYNEILDLLRSHFNEVVAREDTKGAWVSIVYCKNEL